MSFAGDTTVDVDTPGATADDDPDLRVMVDEVADDMAAAANEVRALAFDRGGEGGLKLPDRSRFFVGPSGNTLVSAPAAGPSGLCAGLSVPPLCFSLGENFAKALADVFGWKSFRATGLWVNKSPSWSSKSSSSG